MNYSLRKMRPHARTPTPNHKSVNAILYRCVFASLVGGDCRASRSTAGTAQGLGVPRVSDDGRTYHDSLGRSWKKGDGGGGAGGDPGGAYKAPPVRRAGKSPPEEVALKDFLLAPPNCEKRWESGKVRVGDCGCAALTCGSRRLESGKNLRHACHGSHKGRGSVT